MTLDNLLTISADQWDTLSDEDLHAILHPFFAVTRPDPAKVAEAQKKGSSKGKARIGSSALDDLFAMAARNGLVVPKPTIKP